MTAPTWDQPPEDPWEGTDGEQTTELDKAVDGLHAELLDRDQLAKLPAADALIPGILNRQTYVVLSGRDACYKTFIAKSWCLSLATGTAWHGRPVESVRVLYLIGEGAYDFDARVTAWETDAGIRVPADRFIVLPRVPNMFKPTELPALLEVIRRGGFGLVVVDTLRRASTGAEMNGSDMARVLDSLDAIKRATDDGTVLVLAHTNKADNDARGFSAIEDDADTVWHSQRPAGGSVAVVTAVKMRNGPDGASLTLVPRRVADSIVLQLQAETGHDHRLLAQRISPTARKILDVLHRPGYEHGASGPDLATTANVSKQRLADGLAELIRSGLAIRNGIRGQYLYAPSPVESGMGSSL
jgi:hypothetical protein